MLDPARLAFTDETAVTTKMVRLWGRGPRGVELVGRAPMWRMADDHIRGSLRHIN